MKIASKGKDHEIRTTVDPSRVSERDRRGGVDNEGMEGNMMQLGLFFHALEYDEDICPREKKAYNCRCFESLGSSNNSEPAEGRATE
jgi:hypothetical protein